MNIKEILFFIVFMGAMFVGMILGGSDNQRVVKYDCRLSEISPDYPIEVKEACRKLRADKIK
jgi:hypothetical protein